MDLFKNRHNRIAIGALATSTLVVLASFIWQGHKGFNLWDEGFLWYGVQRVLLGEIPMRDFMAYDPGRYYWTAALVDLFGDNGIMSLRAAVAVFQALGLAVGLFLVAQSQRFRSKGDLVFLLLSVITLAIWMFPRHKLFDISISILLVGVLSYLVTKPNLERYFLAGVCVGLAAVFGRNHGVYGAVASLGVIAWIALGRGSSPDVVRATTVWGLGVIAGFSPTILMLILVPGFAAAFWESILFLFEHRATNLPLPVPWPWTVDFAASSVGTAVRGLLVGLFFIGTLAFAGISLVSVVFLRLKRRPVQPAFVASAFLAFPYAQYAFSRADVAHLAHGVFPLLLGVLVLLTAIPARYKWPLVFALSAASIWVMHPYHPGWKCFVGKQCVIIEVSGEQLHTGPGIARDVTLLRQLADQFAPEGRSFVAAPFWPGAYALLERKSPMWETYALFSRSEDFEKREIERIKAADPGFVFIFDKALDRRDELRFKNTHPLTNQYIMSNFDRVPVSENPAYQIYRARELPR